VENWYDSMPRIKRAGKYDFRPSSASAGGKVGGAGKMKIDSHFKSSHCVVCGLESTSGKFAFSYVSVVFTCVGVRSTRVIADTQTSVPIVLKIPPEHPIPFSLGLTSLNPVYKLFIEYALLVLLHL
jgi:hypothetical protein